MLWDDGRVLWHGGSTFTLGESPLGFPLEPGSGVVSLNASIEAGRDIVCDLRLVDSAESGPDLDRLHEVCHDLRQPVASIIMLAEAALCQAATSLAVRDYLEQVRDQAEWLGDLVQHLLEPCRTSRADNTSPADEDSCDLVRLASDAVQVEMGTYTGELVVQRNDSNMYVRGNWIEIRRTIANLLSNATRAAGPNGKVIVDLLRVDDRVLLTVDDSGPGFGLIRPGVRLGLRVVARSLQSCGGQIEYGRSQLGGVQASLALRAADS